MSIRPETAIQTGNIIKAAPGSPALVFFDIDGTLLDERRTIPESATAAIRTLRRNGHLAFINTGRCPCCILPYIREVGFDGIVASCGAYVEFRGETLRNVTVEPALLDELLPMLEWAPMDVWLEGPEHLYISDLARLKSDLEFANYFRGFEHIFRDWHRTPVQINKLSFELHAGASLDFCRRIIEPHFDLISHSPQQGELVPKGHSKATGIQVLLEHLGLPRSRTFAFGDSPNDLDMLAFAAHGIAMANSRHSVLAVCDHVTAKAADDGIARGLRHYGLI